MVYTIEVSFDIRKQENLTEFQNRLVRLAEYHHCESNYFMHEIEGRRKRIERNHCIFITLFDDDTIETCKNFLRDIRNIKTIYIECIYCEEGICNLIHASPFYLQRMDKNFIKQYKKNRKMNSYLDHEQELINIIRRK